jgi:hypothetical protein
VPPPATTAAFSSARRPGVVFGQRRHAGEPAEQVERDALGGEDRARVAADGEQVATWTDAVAVGGAQVDLELAVHRGEGRRRDVDAGHDAVGLRDHDAVRTTARGHDGLAGQVAPAEVLVECPLDQVAHRADCTSRRVPLAAPMAPGAHRG